MSLLESTTKFNIRNPRGGDDYQDQDFFRWTNNHFYRTSSNDMSAKTPAPRKNMAIPGYAGYRPNIKADGHMGKTITEQSRSVFTRKGIDAHKTMFSSTGFNARLIPQSDSTREATSRRYGTETWHKPSPNHHPENYHATTTRLGFIEPQTIGVPTFRDRNNSACFENGPGLNHRSVKGQSGFGADTHFLQPQINSLASGYTMNRQHWDGSGWGTEKNTHTDQMRTSYRNGFNTPKPFHKMELRNTTGRLKKVEKIFDVPFRGTH